MNADKEVLERTEHSSNPAEIKREKAGNRSRRRWLTLLVAAWVVALVGTAFVLLRPDPPAESLTETAAGSSLAERLYVDPSSQAAVWVEGNAGTPKARQIEQRIAEQPTAKWFGAWSGDVRGAADQYVTAGAEEGKVPVLVAYNLPGRDCGGHSAGGLSTAAEYRTWINGLASGIGDRAAVVVLEPDALAQLDSCLDAAGQQDRLRMLSAAVDRLQSENVSVYLDAGHSNWVPAPEMADRLEKAGVAQAEGFSLNVSNYNRTEDEVAYAEELRDELGMASKPYIVDTSRNGNGSPGGEWCNPAGTKLGAAPRAESDGRLLMWVKAPGESDGDCGAAPGTAAGEFDPDLAEQLITGS